MGKIRFINIRREPYQRYKHYLIAKGEKLVLKLGLQSIRRNCDAKSTLLEGQEGLNYKRS